MLSYFYCFSNDEYAFIVFKLAAMDLWTLSEQVGPFSDFGSQVAISQLSSGWEFLHSKNRLKARQCSRHQRDDETC